MSIDVWNYTKDFFTLFSNRQNVFKTHYCLKSAEKWKVFSHSSTLKLWAQNPQVCMCRKSLVWACMKTNWCFFNCEEQKFFERNVCFSNAFSVFSLIIIAMVTKIQEKYSFCTAKSPIFLAQAIYIFSPVIPPPVEGLKKCVLVLICNKKWTIDSQFY